MGSPAPDLLETLRAVLGAKPQAHRVVISFRDDAGRPSDPEGFHRWTAIPAADVRGGVQFLGPVGVGDTPEAAALDLAREMGLEGVGND